VLELIMNELFTHKYTNKEIEDIRKFAKKHYKCPIKNNALNGGQFSYIFTPMGIGNVIEVRCNYCNKQTNVTDVDCW